MSRPPDLSALTGRAAERIDVDSAKPPPAEKPANAKPRQQGYRRLLGVTTLIKIAGIGLTLISSIVLARALGAAAYGAFAFASTLITFLAIPGAMGTERLTVRHVATYLSKSQPALAYGSYLWGNRTVAISSTLCFAVAATGLLAWSGGWPSEPMAQTSLIALLLVPVFALTKQRQATLRGMHQVAAGLFPELALRPAVHVLLVLAVWWLAAPALDAVMAIALLGVATLLSYGVGNLILRPHLRRHFDGVEPQFEARQWLRSALPFAVMAGIYVVHQKVDVLLLGWLGTAKDVGIFHVVSRCTDATLVFYNALQAGLAPAVAKLYAGGDRQQLQRLIFRSTRTITLLTLAATLVLLVGGPWILGLFGGEFKGGFTALAILALAQLLNVALGPAGMVLNMVGAERVTLVALLVSVAVNIVLNLLLVPQFGVTGAAIATAVALSVLSIVLAVAARHRAGIAVTVFKFL